MNRPFILGSVLVVVLAISLRAYHIGERSLWLDEAIAANISRGTLAETLTLTRGLHSAPIIDPLILYSIEKIASGPLAVRTLSLVASALAVIVMLGLVTIPSIDSGAAGLSALMLGISAGQIRYAQEVREYSLGVLYAGVLLYVYLSYTSRPEEGDSPIPLYLALFVAPFVQYGLVLFGFGMLSALMVLALTGRDLRRGMIRIVAASGFLAFGGLLSFVLTLRYQWGDDAPYLQANYFIPGSNLLRFALSTTHYLVTFLLPGLAVAAISVVAILIFLIASIRARTLSPVAVLACTSCGTVLVCSIVHLYPYGGIRQCLFLAPVLCLFASVSLVQLANRFGGVANSLLFGAIICIVIVSGLLQIRSLKPYAEIEDIQKVLASLRSQIEPGDTVYIYPGAVPAVDFYVKERDARFIYGNFHQQAREKYVAEMLAGLAPDSNRLWLVFSHIHGDEDQRILSDLSKDWKLEPALFVAGSALYLASRRVVVAREVLTQDANVVSGPYKGTSIVYRSHDSFWDWNVRNSRHPAL